MNKRVLTLLAPAAVAVGVALMPASASADVITRCPSGATDQRYCTDEKICVVPNVVGMQTGDDVIRDALDSRNCRLGTTTRIHNGKVVKPPNFHGKTLARLLHRQGVIVTQSLPPGTQAPAKTKVNITITV